MESKLTWKSSMSFTGVADSGIEIPMDAPVEHGGANEGPRPMELILMGLGGCTGMDVISILQKKRQEVTNFEILLHANRADEHPKVFTDITIEFVVTGHNIDADSVARAIELSATKYCPANAMLKQAANIKTIYTVKEA